MHSDRHLSHIERRIIIGAVTWAALWTSSILCAANSYVLTDLGFLPGGSFSVGLGINASGEVTGSSDSSDANGSGQRAFQVRDGVMANLGLPPVPFALLSTAPALNDVGDVVVNGYNGAFHAFIWRDGAFTDLTTLPNAIYSEGRQINNDGHVVGSVVIELPGGNFPHHAFHHDGKQMIDLNSLFGGNYSDATDINQSGAIVGEARFAGSSVIRGFKLQDGVVTVLPLPEITSEASSINEIGEIVGGAYFDGVHEHPMLYANGEMIDLGLPSQATSGTATAINDAGVIVGTYTLPGGLHRAFIYSKGAMTPFADLVPFESGWIIEEANDINAAGVVAATARDAQSHKHAVILTPISTCPADISGDGLTDIDDLLAVIGAWNALGGPADVDSNGVVNVDDLLAVIVGWGPCS
jgi:probable HAF family extracellular repeat protein